MAGNINPSLNLNLDQQASFDVRDPSKDAANLLNAQVSLTNNKKSNFQKGINNAISEAAGNMRNRQSNEGALQRQLEKEEFQRQESISERNFDRQDASEARRLTSQSDLANLDNERAFSKDSIDNSRSLSQHKLNLMGKKAEIQLEAAKNGIGNDEGIQNVLGQIDSEIQATDVALGNTTSEDELISGIAEGLKSTFDEKRAETAASIFENKGKVANAVPITKENTVQIATEMLGEEPTEVEENLFFAQDKLRGRLLSRKKSRDAFATKLEAYSTSTSPQLVAVDDEAESMSDAIELAEQYSVTIDTTAQSEVRSILDTLAASDSEATLEVLDKLKSRSIFKFPEGTPASVQQEVTNNYLTGIDQIIASSSFIARGAGNTGVLTAKDVAFAMKRYISTNGNLDQFKDNLKKGRATTASQMMRQGYLYQDEEATATWRDILGETGYKLNAKDRGMSVEKKTNSDLVQDSVREGTTTFSTPEQDSGIVEGFDGTPLVFDNDFTPEEEARVQFLEEQAEAGLLDTSAQDSVDPLIQESQDLRNNIHAPGTPLNNQFNIIDQKDKEIQSLLRDIGVQ